MSQVPVDARAVREYFDAFGRGDLDRLRDVFAPECVITVPGAGLLAGNYEGAAGLDRFLAVVLSNVDGRRSGFRVDDMAVGERFVITREVANLARADREDVPVELPLLLRFTVGEDGRIARLDITPEDAAAYDAFWAAPAAGSR